MNRLARTFVKLALALSLVLIPAASGGLAADAAGKPGTTPGRHAAPALVTDAQGRRYLEAANGKPRTPIGAAAPAGDTQPGHGTPYAHDQTYGGGTLLITGFQPFAILWQPSGYSVPAGYTALLARYLADQVTATGADEWSLGNLGEYAFPAFYRASAVPTIRPANGGAVLIDTDPFPVGTCSNPYFPVCVSDSAIVGEIRAFGGRNGLNLATEQPALFLPPGMGYDGFLTSSCAYHGTDGNGLTYMTMGYDAVSHDLGNGTSATCNTSSHPNGNDADATISNFSHEEAETMTDPAVGSAWEDRVDNEEVGDSCSWVFPPDQTSFNQKFQVNGKTGAYGHTYYVQMEWSNEMADVQAQYGGQGLGCINY